MFRLFKRKPRLDSADAQLRIAALQALDADNQQTFARLFLNDGDREVRLAALARLTRTEMLLAGLDDETVAEPTATRLLALLDDDSPPSIRRHPAVLGVALAGAKTPEDALRIAAWTEDVQHRAAAAFRARASVRLALAEATWEPAMLAELEKRARGRDKSMHRIARHRLAEWKTATAERVRQDSRTEQLLAAATALDASDPHYDARRDAIERDWARHWAAVEATDGLLARFGVAPRDAGAADRLPVRRETPAAAGVDFESLLTRADALRDAAQTLVAAEPDGEALAACRRWGHLRTAALPLRSQALCDRAGAVAGIQPSGAEPVLLPRLMRSIWLDCDPNFGACPVARN